jgi:hypothetical protein
MVGCEWAWSIVISSAVMCVVVFLEGSSWVCAEAASSLLKFRVKSEMSILVLYLLLPLCFFPQYVCPGRITGSGIWMC